MIILRSWKESLQIFKELPAFLKQSFSLFAAAIILLFDLLKWVILFDVGLFMLFGKKLMVALEQIADKAPSSIPPSVALLSMAASIVIFLLQGAFLVLVRKKATKLPLREYFKQYFFRYVQLALFFSLVMMVLILFVGSLGVTKVPTIHWSVIFGFRFLELIILFYWLDSQFSFRSMLKACEKGLNFVLYSLPLLVLTLGFGVLVLFALQYVLGATSHWFSLPEMPGALNDVVSGLGAVLVRYGKLALEFWWICFLFVLYQNRKKCFYNESLFN